MHNIWAENVISWMVGNGNKQSDSNQLFFIYTLPLMGKQVEGKGKNAEKRRTLQRI